MDYLRWYRRTLDLPVRNDVQLERIEPDGDIFALRVRTSKGPETILARRVVLATGYESSGEWHIPPFLKDALPANICFHSNRPIDFSQAAGKRIGILGHGASAFDAALAALRHGAASVDLCYRRPSLPTSNPHRWFEFAGFLKHFAELDDATRWSINHHVDLVDQPPARHSFDEVASYSNFRSHAASPWLNVSYDDNLAKVATPTARLDFDFVVAATGSQVDLTLRPELSAFVGDIALWQDRYEPPAEERHPSLGRYPYLNGAYAFQERVKGAAPFLPHIFAFNFSSIISCGPHSTSISGHKYAIPRLINGVTSSLFLEQQSWVVPSLKAYDEVELHLPVRDGAPAVSLFGAHKAAG
jgi:FAD-dependent urate hydroxylase